MLRVSKLFFNKRVGMQLVELIVLMFIAFVLVFILMHIIPGSTAKLANAALPLEQQRALIAQYGLDKPLATQFFIYVGNIFTKLDFGISLSVRTNDLVVNILGPKIFLSLVIGLISLGISLVVGYLIGTYFGINNRNFLGNAGNVLISFLLALPSFIIATIVVSIVSLTNSSNLILFKYEQVETWILPIITLSIPTTAVLANLVSGEIINQSREQYIKFAKAKGLNTWTIMTRHLFRRGIFSVISQLPGLLLGIIIGGLFIDSIFSVPGIGGVLGAAIITKDYDIIQTLILLFAFMTSLTFWLRDILYVFSDPRLIRVLT
ncbi:Oligopeptide ABC transporter permease protein OppoB [[Mycoplasma] cavipharyngis]|uniref:ABC transporter permease n=1 Tax=[Mycoplasma] cavipharyngis TaxID=92757 RepID=UPI0037045BE5